MVSLLRWTSVEKHGLSNWYVFHLALMKGAISPLFSVTSKRQDQANKQTKKQVCINLYEFGPVSSLASSVCETHFNLSSSRSRNHLTCSCRRA